MPELIECPVCNHDVSTAATSCPGCGHPMQAQKRAYLGPPHECSHCGGRLAPEKEATSEGSGCLIFLVGILLAPFLLGIPIVIYGLHLMTKRKAYWRCKSCQQRFDRVVKWYELG